MAVPAYMEIGGVCFSIDIAGGDQNAVLIHDQEPAYRSFFDRVVTDDAIAVDVRIEMGHLPAARELTEIFAGDQSWSMFKEDDNYWILRQPPAFSQPLWAAHFKKPLKRVTILCGKELITEKEGKRFVSNPLRYPLDQVLLMYVLADRQGAVIHAAGLEIDGKGFIFPGKSGAGKSTISRRFAERKEPARLHLLSDDRMIARSIGGAFKAFGTPWPGEAGIAENRHMPLSAVLFLNHGTQNRIQELDAKAALERLLPVTSIPWYDQEVMGSVFDFCEQLVNRVPCFDLHFTPDAGVVAFLEKKFCSGSPLQVLGGHFKL